VAAGLVLGRYLWDGRPASRAVPNTLP
jgi:hypothetical protein